MRTTNFRSDDGWNHIHDLALDLLERLLAEQVLPLTVARNDQENPDERAEERERCGDKPVICEGHEAEVQADQDGGGTDADLRQGETHESGRLGFGFGPFAAKFSRQMLPRERCENTVFDSRRKVIGPLVDGLICHSDGGGSCSSGPAEQFNGF